MIRPVSLLLLILILGTFLRFYLITEIPLGLYPDEAMNGNNALEALATGKFKVFYPENNGREGLFINLQAASLKIFGNEPWVLRLISALFGVFTILGVYLVTKELFFNRNPKLEVLNTKQILNPDDQNSKPFRIWILKNWNLFRNSDLEIRISHGEIVALLSAYFLAVSYWHLNFSRIGFRAIMVPFFAAFGIYFLLKGLRKGKILDIVLAGIFIGLGFYSYLAFRFMPFVLFVPMSLYFWRWKKKQIDYCFPCLVSLFLLTVLVVTLPLVFYFLQNPQDFFGRTEQVSIFSAALPVKEFIKSNLLTLGMFFFRGDCNWRHNFNCQPELHPLAALFFITGFIVTVRNFKIGKFRNLLKVESEANIFASDGRSQGIRREGEFWKIENLTLMAWFVFMTLPATLTKEGLPHALRSIGLIPPVMILAGAGAYWFGQKILGLFEKQKIKWPKYLDQLRRIQKELTLLFILVLLLIPLVTYRDYFLRWAENPKTYFAFSTDLYHLGQFLNGLPQDIKKYVVVNLSGVEVRGIPTPAQTVMFVTDTFREEEKNRKNIYYLTPSDFSQGLQIKEQDKVVISFLDGADSKLINVFRQKFPKFKVQAPADFVVMQNY